MSIQSLESERQSILQRMQMSRSGYRHMLMDDTPAAHHKPAAHFAEEMYGAPPEEIETHDAFPRSATMRFITRHPLACTLAVAALIVIGPRRIVRMARRSAPTLAAVTPAVTPMLNRGNIDLLGRLLALGTQYLQRSGGSWRR